MFSHFDITLTSDGQTDGETQGYGIYRASIALRGKMVNVTLTAPSRVFPRLVVGMINVYTKSKYCILGPFRR